MKVVIEMIPQSVSVMVAHTSAPQSGGMFAQQPCGDAKFGVQSPPVDGSLRSTHATSWTSVPPKSLTHVDVLMPSKQFDMPEGHEID